MGETSPVCLSTIKFTFAHSIVAVAVSVVVDVVAVAVAVVAFASVNEFCIPPSVSKIIVRFSLFR